MPVFDPAIFDPNIFDTPAVTVPSTGAGQQQLIQLRRHRRKHTVPLSIPCVAVSNLTVTQYTLTAYVTSALAKPLSLHAQSTSNLAVPLQTEATLTAKLRLNPLLHNQPNEENRMLQTKIGSAKLLKRLEQFKMESNMYENHD